MEQKRRILKMKRVKCYIITFLGAIIFLCGCANPIKDGTEALEKKDYAAAVTAFQEAADSEDKETSADGYRGLGIAFFEQEKYTQALSYLEKAVGAGSPQMPQIYNLMGISAMQIKETEKAKEYFAAGIALAGTGTGGAVDSDLVREMRYNEIVCMEELLDWKGASEKAEQYILLYPDDEGMKKEAEFLKTR